MLKTSLFLGFRITESYSFFLSKISPEILQIFVQDQPIYLKRVKNGEDEYLGKEAGSLADVDQLVLLEQNILSLLKKLVPDYPYHEQPLILIPIEK